MNLKPWIRTALAGLLLMAVCSPVMAEDAVPDTAEKIRWIETRLSEAGRPAKVWQYGWTAAFGSMTALYTADARSRDGKDEKEERHDAVVNAASSFLGVCGMIMDPMDTWKAADRLKNLPESNETERQIKLKDAEDLLRNAAEREVRGRSWQTHALAGLVNLAAGIAVATDNRRYGDGFAMFAGGMLVSEIQIFTTPQKARKAWDEYRQGTAPAAGESQGKAARLAVTPFSRGIAVSGCF